jgi:hypothetical protein
VPGGARLVIVTKALASVEDELGIAAVLTSAPPHAYMDAAAFKAYSAFVLVAMQGGTALQSCGCFGEVETPPSALHVLLNTGFALTALASAATGVPSLGDTISAQEWNGVPFLLLVAITVGLSYVVLTTLPVALRAASLARS